MRRPKSDKLRRLVQNGDVCVGNASGILSVLLVESDLHLDGNCHDVDDVYRGRRE